MALKTAAQFTKHFQTTKCFDKVLNKVGKKLYKYFVR